MISFNDVTVTYDSFTAVRDLAFDVKEGEFFTFLGPSGCGKTTTLRTLAGLTMPSSGAIYLNGKNITEWPTDKRGIKMVFQSYALFPTMTVYENIAFGPKVNKVKKQVIDEKVRAIAKTVDLREEQLFKKVSDLSGGQQQRVSIARALVNEPSILVLDEPLSNLDARLRVQLRNELKRLQKQVGITTIYVTHDQEEALTLSDRIAVFNEGVIEQIGTPEEVYEQSASEFVCNFIGESNDVTGLVKSNQPLFPLADATAYASFYMRIEKVKMFPYGDRPGLAENDVLFHGTVVETEYYGLYTKYTVDVQGTRIRAVVKEKLPADVKRVYVAMNQKQLLAYR